MRNIVLTILFCLFSIVAILKANTAVAQSQSNSEQSAKHNTIPTLFNEYPIAGTPQNIVSERPGHLWFTLPDQSAIGSLVITSTVDYRFTQYTTPTANAKPYDLVYDDGVIWFTEESGNQLGRLVISTGAIQEFPIPTANSQPTGIDITPGGELWFTQRGANQLAHFDPTTEAFAEYAYITDDAGLEDIAIQVTRDAAQSVHLWFTAPNVNELGNFDVERTTFFKIPTGQNQQPLKVTLDSTGLPWVTISGSNKIGRYSPGTLSFWRWYDTNTFQGGPANIAFYNNNGAWQLWYTENVSTHIGRLTVEATGAKVELLGTALQHSDSRPAGIAVSSDGRVWIADMGRQTIVEWRSPYAHFIYLPSIPE